MKNKFIVISLIFMLLLSIFTFNNNVYATSVSDLSEDKVKLLIQRGYSYMNSHGVDISQFSNYQISKTGSISYYPKNCSFGYNNWGSGIFQSSYRYSVDFNLDTLEVISSSDCLDHSSVGDDIYVDRIAYASMDIYNNRNDIVFAKNIDFFYPAPQGITATLVEETEKVQIAEQLKIMIAGFLKYLIALVISVIAFYKGWKFLSTQLKKS